MSKPKGHRFWVWSVGAYEMPGAKNRLIYLQDGFGFDVNISLWCCWRAAEGEKLSEDAIRAAERSTKEWSEGVIEPLREARRNAHELGPAEFYTQLKDAELAAEKREQEILFNLSRDPSPIEADAVADVAKSNMALYASLIDAPRRDGYSSALLRDLIDHIFPSVESKGAGHS